MYLLTMNPLDLILNPFGGQKPNVFDLYRMKMGDKAALYRRGLVSFSQLNSSGVIKNDKQRRQIEFELQEKATWIDQKKIREFLETLSFPLYFLDFESIQPAIPFCQGNRRISRVSCQEWIHKAQGAEYPVVVMPIMMTHFSMLQRNLLYTGVTRAKTGLILVGQKKAVGYCVRNVTVDKRNTLLAERLSGKI